MNVELDDETQPETTMYIIYVCVFVFLSRSIEPFAI